MRRRTSPRVAGFAGDACSLGSWAITAGETVRS